MAIDIFAPQVSEVVKGLEGKTILVYGSNRTGKTKNASKFPKPLFASFERGLNGIAGIANIPISKWKDWRDLVKQLTDEENIKKAKEAYNTIVIDTIDHMGELGSQFVADAYGVQTIAEGRGGYGLWKEYEAEINKWLRLLTNAGYTLVFIGHDDSKEFKRVVGGKTEKYNKIVPKGDKRVIDPICNLVDIIGYAQAVSDDEDSTLFLKDTQSYKAGSRFDYLVDSIPQWTADKLSKAIQEAIEAEEKASGKKAITATQQAQKAKVDVIPMATIIEGIKNGYIAIGKGLKEGEAPVEYFKIVEEAFGGAVAIEDNKLVKTSDKSIFKLSECTEKSREQLEIVYDALSKKGYIKA